MIILCEKKYAEERLVNGFTRSMSVRDLSILAKYYKYLGKNEEQTRNCLVEFCKKFDDDYNEVLYFNSIRTAMNKYKKESLRIYTPVGITKNEIKTIRGYSDYQVQKLLFLIVFVSKMTHKEEYSEYLFYYGSSFVLSSVGSRLCKERREEIEGLIQTEGLASFNDRNKGWRINFVDKNQEDFEFTIDIEKFEDVMSYLPMLCSNCNKPISQTTSNKSYCKECWKEKNKEQIKNRVQNFRNKTM